MPDLCDVAVETDDSGYFQFLNVQAPSLRDSLDKALADEAALSLVNADSCVLVVPWRLVKSVSYIPSSADEHEDKWITLWERAHTDEPRRIG